MVFSRSNYVLGGCYYLLFLSRELSSIQASHLKDFIGTSIADKPIYGWKAYIDCYERFDKYAEQIM